MARGMTYEFAHYTRYLWTSRGLVVVLADARPLVPLRESYMRRYGIDTPYNADVYARFDTFMAAVGLAAVSLVDREYWGWSVNFPGETEGFFVAAEAEGLLCGRIRETPKEGCGAVVQRQKAGEQGTQSFFEPNNSDPVETVQTYFEVAMQTTTRMAVPTLEHAVLVQALPHGKMDDLWALDNEALVAAVQGALATGELEQIEEVVLFYECRCTPELIDEKLRLLPSEQFDEIWNEHGTAMVECPRCGRNFKLTKN